MDVDIIHYHLLWSTSAHLLDEGISPPHFFISLLLQTFFFCFFFLFGLSPTIRLQLDTRNSEPCELPKCVVKSIFKVLNGDASICFLFLKKFNKRLNSSSTSTPLFIFFLWIDKRYEQPAVCMVLFIKKAVCTAPNILLKSLKINLRINKIFAFRLINVDIILFTKKKCRHYPIL